MTALPEPAPESAPDGGPRVHGASLTPYGIFLLAENYHRAADILHESKKLGRRDNPMRLLYYHALEGYMRAFLRMNGHEPGKIRSYMHDFARMYKDCETAGLVLRARTAAFLRETKDDSDYVRVRYEFDLSVPEERREPGKPGKELGRLVSAVKEVGDKIRGEIDRNLKNEQDDQRG